MFQAEIKSSIEEDISILLKQDNHPWNYICECGNASSLTVKEIRNTNAIFISHTHIDHFVNFDTIIRYQIGIQRKVVICGPKGIANQIQSRIKSYTWNLIDRNAIIYEIREVISDSEIVIFEIRPPVWELLEIKVIKGNTIFEEKSSIVTTVLLDHKIPTLAYKFEEADAVKIDITSSTFKGGSWVRELKEAYKNNGNTRLITIDKKEYRAEKLFHLLHIQKGDSIGIIMDHIANTENHKKIKKHFFNCRKVFIECFYKNEDKELAILNYHSYAKMSAKVMREAEVKEAIAVHFSRKYGESEITELVNEFNHSLNLFD